METRTRRTSLILPAIFFIFSLTVFPQEKPLEEYVEMSLEELMNVTITTAAKKPQTIKDTPASVVLITRREIERFGYATLEEILQNVPGFYMIDDYFWQGGVNFGIRGFYSTGVFNDIAILVNGVHQREDYFDSYNIAQINVPVEAIDRIEVIRGPMSIMYGSNAFMGAINIITNQPDKPSPRNGRISISGGSDEARQIFFRAFKHSEKMSVIVNASVYDDSRTGKPYKEMTRFPFPEWWGPRKEDDRIPLHLGKKYFGFNTRLSYLHFDISHVENVQNVVDGNPGIHDGDFAKTVATKLALNWDRKVSKNTRMTAKLSYFKNYQTNEYTHNESNVNQLVSFYQQETQAFEGEFYLFHTPIHWLNLTTGLQQRRSLMCRSIINNPPGQYDNLIFRLPTGDHIVTSAWMAQGDFRIARNVELITGIRLEKMSAYDLSIVDVRDPDNIKVWNTTYDPEKINVIPRTALIIDINHNNTIKFMAGKAIKHPSYGQNNEVFKAYWLSNATFPPLEPAKIETLEINYITTISKHIQSSFSIFRNRLDNLISRDNFVDEEGNTRWGIANADRMSTFGIEMATQISLGDRFHMDMDLTYQDSQSDREELTGINLAYAPKWLGYIKMSFNIDKDSSFSISGRYVDGMETKWDLESDETDKRIGVETDSYFIMDANLRFNRFFYRNLYLNCHINNLLDQEIRYPTTGNSLWAEKGTIGRGFSFFITLGLRF